MRSGYGKIFDIAAYGATFPARGMPAWIAYIAVPAEFFGGIALILGLATRYVVLVMLLFMVVATFSTHHYWTFSRTGPARAGFRLLQERRHDRWLPVPVCGRARPADFDGWLRNKR